jgi:hypothetical protein
MAEAGVVENPLLAEPAAFETVPVRLPGSASMRGGQRTRIPATRIALPASNGWPVPAGFIHHERSMKDSNLRTGCPMYALAQSGERSSRSPRLTARTR